MIINFHKSGALCNPNENWNCCIKIMIVVMFSNPPTVVKKPWTRSNFSYPVDRTGVLHALICEIELSWGNNPGKLKFVKLVEKSMFPQIKFRLHSSHPGWHPTCPEPYGRLPSQRQTVSTNHLNCEASTAHTCSMRTRLEPSHASWFFRGVTPRPRFGKETWIGWNVQFVCVFSLIFIFVFFQSFTPHSWLAIWWTVNNVSRGRRLATKAPPARRRVLLLCWGRSLVTRDPHHPIQQCFHHETFSKNVEIHENTLWKYVFLKTMVTCKLSKPNVPRPLAYADFYSIKKQAG